MQGEMAAVPQHGRELGHSAPHCKRAGVGHFFCGSRNDSSTQEAARE